MARGRIDPDALADALLERGNAGRGQRRALARAITLVESTRPDQAAEAQALLEKVLPATGRALRVGISGTPGVGKSTFVEALGLKLCDEEKRVAVLAVDPSSPLSGGSILGDKTRMEALGRRAEAFIRPSPSQGALGGVARRTREAMLLCEAAGFDVVIVETVGVGQSEVEVASMVDTFTLLMQPAAGDALQGVKRGVLELADLLVVNKADGDLLAAARETKRQYVQGLALLRPPVDGWKPPVVLCSARERTGLDEVWAEIEAHRAHLAESGRLEARRAAQAERWLRSAFLEEVERRLQSRPRLAGLLDEATRGVRAHTQSPTRAARALADAVFDESAPDEGR